MQERYARKLILDILHDPENHMHHARSYVSYTHSPSSFLPQYFTYINSIALCYRYAASVVTSFTYGRPNPISYAEPSIRKVTQCAQRVGIAARPGGYLVDAFPVLRYAPGWIYWPLQELRRWHREELELFKGQMDSVRKKKVCLKQWDFSCERRDTHH
jgi:hypothetical protein